MDVKRGDIVVVAAPGDYGKPRPALVLQSDLFRATESVIVALITSDQRPQAPLFRRPIQPSATNGLRHASDVMLDKLVTLSRAKVSNSVGHLADSEMAGISASLALFLGLAG